jgi:hypothetical protein
MPPHEPDDPPKTKEAEQDVVVIVLKEITHAVVTGTRGGGGGVPVVNSDGHVIAWAHRNHRTGMYEYVDPVSTLVIEVASAGGGSISAGGTIGPAGKSKVGGGEAAQPIPDLHGVIDQTGAEKDSDDPWQAPGLPEITSGVTVSSHGLFTSINLACPGSFARTARIDSSLIFNPTNTGENPLWLAAFDEAGRIIAKSQVVLDPGQSLPRYEAPAGAVSIGVACAGGSNVGTTQLTHSIPVS